MKASELRSKSMEDLQGELSSLLRAHFGLRMQKATQQLTNHQTLGTTKRDIARVQTLINEKKRAGGAA